MLVMSMLDYPDSPIQCAYRSEYRRSLLHRCRRSPVPSVRLQHDRSRVRVGEKVK